MTAGERDGRGYPRDHDGYPPYGSEFGGYADWRDESPSAPAEEFADYRGQAYGPSSGYPQGYSQGGYYPDSGGYPDHHAPSYARPAYDDRGGYPPGGYAPAEPSWPGDGYSPPSYPRGDYQESRYPAGYAEPGYPPPGQPASDYPPRAVPDRPTQGFAAPDYRGAGYAPTGYPAPAADGYPDPRYSDASHRPRHGDSYAAGATGYQPVARPDRHPDSWDGWGSSEDARYSDRGAELGPAHERLAPERLAPVRQTRPGGDSRPPRRPAAGRPAGRGETAPGRKRRGLPLWQELPLLLVIALCLAVLVRTFLLQAFYIPSGSMEETLVAGDRVLVNKVVYHFREPARGEVVVFQGTDAWEPVGGQDEDIGLFARGGRVLGDLVGVTRPGASDYIKRVVGLPGDTVSCCDVDGRVYVNGQPLNEEYVIRDSPLDDVPLGDCRGRRFDEVVVQPGHMFVMGDHRQVSQDSRCQGQIPLDNVIGRAFIIVWPSDRWTGLSQPDTFAAVPGAQGAVAEQAPADAQPMAQTLGVAGSFGMGMSALLAYRRTFRGDSPGLRRRVRPIRRRLAA